MKVIYNYAAGPAFRAALDRVSAEGLEVASCAESNDRRLFDLLDDAQVLWHCLRPVDRRVIEAAPDLKLIQKIGVGVNTIDLELAAERGIAVCNMPGTNSRAVAEHTLGLMFAVLRQIPQFDLDLRQGAGWSWHASREDRLGELAGRTVGLIGFGAVPTLLAPILDALGASICYTATAPKPAVPHRYCSLDELLEEADIVSLHVPLNRATARLMNAERFRAMRRGAILINTARGGLVDEPALLDALDSGQLGGAGLDVLDQEPASTHQPLLKRPQVVLTPHVAWLTQETLNNSLTVAVDNCLRLANAQPLLHQVV